MNRTHSLAPAVMRDAWVLYHALVSANPADATRATFSLCLRYAWEREPRRYAAKIRAVWAQMGAAEQLESARKMVRKAARDFEAKTGGAIPWGQQIELDDAASETWALLQERIDTLELTQARRNRENQSPLQFPTLLYRAASEALRRILREMAHNGGMEFTPELEGSALSSENTEQTVLLRAALEVVKSPEQKAVLALLLQGETVREIAAQLCRSKSAIQRTIQQIRAQVSALLAA